MAATSRRTINDSDTWVCSQFWEAADGSIWWDLKYLFIYLKNNQWVESYLRKCAKWLNMFEKTIAVRARPSPGKATPRGLRRDSES